MQTEILILFLIIINFLSILITVIDKLAAKNKKTRISEATLILFSVLGGSVGMFLTMHIIHHKTRKPKFMLGIPIIIALQLLLTLYLLKNTSFFQI